MIEQDYNPIAPKALSLPRHPLFDTDEAPPSFIDCLDAIDHVRLLISLCDAIDISEDGGGLSADAASGYYRISLTMRNTLAYISKRLMALERDAATGYQQASDYLSAVAVSLQNLDDENHELFLNSVASTMDVSRLTVDQFIHTQATK